MSSIAPTSIQQIQQMGTATEKLQHSLQNIPNAAGQQHKEERKVSDEVKRTTVQNAEESNQSNTINPDGTRRKSADRKSKKNPAEDDENVSSIKKEALAPRSGQGSKINLIV